MTINFIIALFVLVVGVLAVFIIVRKTKKMEDANAKPHIAAFFHLRQLFNELCLLRGGKTPSGVTCAFIAQCIRSDLGIPSELDDSLTFKDSDFAEAEARSNLAGYLRLVATAALGKGVDPELVNSIRGLASMLTDRWDAEE